MSILSDLCGWVTQIVGKCVLSQLDCSINPFLSQFSYTNLLRSSLGCSNSVIEESPSKARVS